MEVSGENTATITPASFATSPMERQAWRRSGAQTAFLLVGRHAKRRLNPLQEWRLRKALRFIEEHLEAHISLASMAKAAGLTRMHFAAQFRLATGARPHDYVLHRRIERACDLLSQSSLPIVEVALIVGFQTQAHFTTVFKRFTGAPPLRWRQYTWSRSDAPSRSRP